MPSIQDVRINNMLTSETVVPYVAISPTVLTWDYDGNLSEPAPSKLDIRFGTSDDAWGENSFSGNVISKILETSANSFESDNIGFSRGTTCYGQIANIDFAGNYSAWTKFKFKVNRLPYVSNFRLTPTQPTQNDNIDLIFSYHDADGHDQSGSKIRWYRNNLPVVTYDGLCTLPSSATSPNDTWSAKIIPSDGIEFGKTVETVAVTIQSLDFGFSSINILPTDANVDDLLKVEWELLENEYTSNSGDIVIEWFLNGSSVPDSNKTIIRLQMEPNDTVYVVVKLIDGDFESATGTSDTIIIQDVLWHVFDVDIDGLSDNAIEISNTEPFIEWNIHKTTAESNDTPDILRVVITKTESIDGAVFDSGVVEYTKNSFVIPENTLSRGQKYFIHVGVGEDEILEDQYITKEVRISGSSWEINVNNSTGWTIEYNISIAPDSDIPDDEDPNMGIYIHDGKYFCALIMYISKITLISEETASYSISTSSNLQTPKIIRICGKDNNIRVFMDSKLIIDAQGFLSNSSKLKRLEIGDIDGKNTNFGVIKFIRYSTLGAYGLDESLDDTFYFSTVGNIKDGSVECVFDDVISWLPDDTSESSKLIKFNVNNSTVNLHAVNKNYSPITSIHIDNNRNKYIGTANGITAIYGEKHDPDYEFSTEGDSVAIQSEDFDRISNVPIEKISLVEPSSKSDWFTIDTTFRSVGVSDPNEIFPVDDEYDPYILGLDSHAIHYYSQRTHGHAWYDRVDNSSGWQVQFGFELETLEADDFSETNMEKQGFGIYVNDGTYQEIIHFYDDRIRLFYANVFVPIDMTQSRNFTIVGKEQNIRIYQTLQQSGSGGSQLLMDASGMFTTQASSTGNSHRPKIIIDPDSNYHSVWHDDSAKKTGIYYSKLSGGTWSNPELVGASPFGTSNPTIDIDSRGRIWVAYEDISWGKTEIAVSVKDAAGWNPKIRITNNKSNKARPSIKADSIDDVHVVWEDDRNGHWEIFWAKWDNETQSWTSSNHFGSDTVIMQNNSDDPYLSDVGFKQASLAFASPYLWVICEATSINDNSTSVVIGNRNINTGFWNTSGTPFVEDGEVVGFGESVVISPTGRSCVNPSIAASPTNNCIVVTWTDGTEPISQIWGASLSTAGNIIEEATQITSQNSNCDYSCVGFVYNQAVILFEKNESIYLSHYNTSFQQFNGTATGSTDVALTINNADRQSKPAIAQQIGTKTFVAIYEFNAQRDPSLLSTIEFPDFTMIGSVRVEHSETQTRGGVSTTETLGTDRVSEIDTKEFAFGDFSENLGVISHWKDIKMYFGYDAIPKSISKFNTNTVTNWPDNRINDLFVDVFGNIISATFGGLLYHNVGTGDVTNIQGLDSNNTSLLSGKLTTSVKWGKNGVWYVGTTSGLFYSKTAGKIWSKLHPEKLETKTITSISINPLGQAVCAVRTPNGFDASVDGLYVAHPDLSEPIFIKTDRNIRCVAVDESNIIWAGGDSGLIRVENNNSTNIMLFNKNSGMRSSKVNDIAIVSKYVRYIATSTGVERMHGLKFSNLNTKTHGILNNIASIAYHEQTNSLWIGALYDLHEIVFRDPATGIIEDEITHYSTLDISTEEYYDKDTFFILDTDLVDLPTGTELNTESSKVYINKNLIDFGYSVNGTAQSIKFDTDLLVDDDVELEISNKFIEMHDFNQSAIEKSIKGDLRRSISKMDRTNKGQLLMLSTIDKHDILLHNDSKSNLPFGTVMIDRDPPFGCLEKLETISKTVLRFKILAYDNLSGIDGFMLSNYENFTEDGETPLEFSPLQTTVEHNIGNSLNNVINSLSIPDTETINNATQTIGDGSALGIWTDNSTALISTYLFAATSYPVVIYKFAQVTNEWAPLTVLDNGNTNRYVTEIKTIFNILYITTGDSTGNGAIYKSIDGTNFQLVASVTGSSVNGIDVSSDGTIYFGSSDGKIYQLRNDIFSVLYQNIGQSINSLSVFENTLIVGTGTRGRVYTINLSTGDNLIVLDTSDTSINQVFIHTSENNESQGQTNVYVSGSDTSTIYRGNVEDFEFSKSYSSFNQTISRIKSVSPSVLTDEETEEISPIVVAAIGKNLFKKTTTAWEFFYKHDEDINDFIEYFSNGVNGIWIISENKVTKWTAVIDSKIVYLKLRDKAGNISDIPVVEPACPNETTSICCGNAYTIKISDLKNFVNESRIVEISEYGEIVFTYDSPSLRTFFSADQIDEEIGIYTSEVFNGSNDLVSWKSIRWDSNEPDGTSVKIQIRYGQTEDDTLDLEWSKNLVVNDNGIVSLEHVTSQYFQFRAILTSSIRDLSPTLSSVTLRNITAQSSHFFTTNFVMPSRPIKGLLTSNTFVPVTADIVFGINTNNSIDFGDYQIIEPNRLFTTARGQFGSNLRIGAKLLSPGIVQIEASNNPGDPYDSSSYVCSVDFTHENIENTVISYDFRIRFYNDPFRTQLIHTFFTGNDRTGWYVGNSDTLFPSNGLDIDPGNSQYVFFTPGSLVSSQQRWYITVDAWNGSFFESINSDKSYICSSCNLINEPGLIAEYYKTGLPAEVTEMPDLSKYTPNQICTETIIDFHPDSGWTSTTCGNIVSATSNFAIRFRGRLQAPISGLYKIILLNDNQASLFIDGDQVLGTDATEISVELSEGYHDLVIHYFESTGESPLVLKWIIPGEINESIIPETRLSHIVTSEYCEDQDTPRILNFAVIFELENGETVRVNI